MPRCSGELKNLRFRAKWSQNKLARAAELDRATVSKAENGDEVAELTVSKLCSALSTELGTEIGPQQILVG
ncbi:XRE family transcriptional regulator [Agrobacterium tumefaciens]|nr:XRE family transcriptional regulator [Agrobacterium tumefaciens]